MIAGLPSRLEKHQTLDILHVTDFCDFLKIDNFRIFQYFRKSSAAHTKIIVRALFYVNMLDKKTYNWMVPFSKDMFY